MHIKPSVRNPSRSLRNEAMRAKTMARLPRHMVTGSAINTIEQEARHTSVEWTSCAHKSVNERRWPAALWLNCRAHHLVNWRVQQLLMSRLIRRPAKTDLFSNPTLALFTRFECEDIDFHTS